MKRLIKMPFGNMIRHLSFEILIGRIQFGFGFVFEKFFIDRLAGRRISLFNNIDHAFESDGQRFKIRLRFQALNEQDLLARFDQLVARMAEQQAGVSEEEVAADVAAARAELDK